MKIESIKEPYILIIVHARLGNLLFQLSAGLKYAKDNDLNFYWAPLLADSRRDYKNYIESNDFLETIFRNIADSYIDKEFFVSKVNEKVKLSEGIFNNVYKYGFYRDAFNYKSIPQSKNIVLFGQFYNYKYLDYSLCQNVFAIPPEISTEIQNLYGDISNYTSIHVRRGDFVAGDGLCLDKSYYMKCISKFELNTNFLVISDDIEWCKQNFISEDYNFIFADKSSNISGTIFDLYLITKCENNICSKSTFSWWGAFLNNNNKKKVLYPTSIGDVLHKRVPKDWTKIYILRIQMIYYFKYFHNLFHF